VIVTPAEALASVARPPAARGRRTLTELAEGFLRWLDAHHRPQTTIGSYGNALSAFLTYATAVCMVYPDQVTVLSIDGYFVWLRSRGKAASTMAHRRSVLVAFWKWLEHEGFAERNVPSKTYPIKTPKRLPIYLEPHQIDDFLAKLGALTNLTGQRDHAVVATFFYSGVRVSELASLRVADVDLVAGRIRINLGKGAKDRILFVPPRLRPILAAYLAQTRPQLVGRRMGRVVAPSRSRKRPSWSIKILPGRSRALSVGALGGRSAAPARTAGPAADGPRLAVRQCPPGQCPPPQPARSVAPVAVVVLRDPESRLDVARREALAAQTSAYLGDLSALPRRAARNDCASPRTQ
jgi:site-specific recombinase XerD